MKTLFEKNKLGSVTLKNRFFRAATWENMATEDGHLTDRLRRLYLDLAKGGVGAVLTSYAYICQNEQPNPHMLGIYDDSFIPEYRELTEAVHAQDCRI